MFTWSRRKAESLGKGKGKREFVNNRNFKRNNKVKSIFVPEGKPWNSTCRGQILKSRVSGLHIVVYFAERTKSRRITHLLQSGYNKMSLIPWGLPCAIGCSLLTQGKLEKKYIFCNSDFAFGFQNKCFKSELVLVLTKIGRLFSFYSITEANQSLNLPDSFVSLMIILNVLFHSTSLKSFLWS